MISATIHDAQGAILEAMTGSESDIKAFTSGRQFIDGFFKASEFYVADGVAVEKPPKPGEAYVWDCVSNKWTLEFSTADAYAREKRSRLLQLSDWTDTASAPARMGQPLYDAWQSYRQGLRDVTKQPEYPFQINWPSAPI